MQGEFAQIVNDCMARIIAAGVTDNDICLFCDQIDDPPFALIPPLSTNNSYYRHIVPQLI